MKPEQDDRRLEEVIRRAVGSEDAQFDAGDWKEKHHQDVVFLESRRTYAAAKGHRRWSTWRTIMGKRSVTIAASAAVAAGIVVAIILFAAGGGSTVAMAAVLEQLQTTCYEFEMGVRTDDGASTSVKGMVLEPGKMRLEQRGGFGTVASIIDSDAGQSLILFERFKAAYRFDMDEAKKIRILDLLTLPRRSIENLWDLRAGNETSLGQKTIDGKSAEGFRVTQEHEEYIQTITVWADAKTAHPLEVEILSQSSKDDTVALALTLTHFSAIPEPDVTLFSTTVPAEYTLANRQTLEQLTGESRATTSTTKDTTPQARKVLDAIGLWIAGKTQEAGELLVAVDWSADLRFGREHHLFTMTEQQYISLVSADQEKVITEIMAQSSQCRAIARTLVKLGQKARATKDVNQAEKYFSTTVRLGQLLNRDTEMMLIVRMVGIAIERLALTELSSLYKELGETEKLQKTHIQINHNEEQLKQIKESVSGG